MVTDQIDVVMTMMEFDSCYKRDKFITKYTDFLLYKNATRSYILELLSCYLIMLQRYVLVNRTPPVIIITAAFY